MDSIILLLKKILSIGVNQSQPQSLQNRIKYTNVVALANTILIAIPFIIFSAIKVPSITYLPVLFLFVCLFCELLLYFNFINISRILLSINPVLIGAIYHALLLNKDDSPILSLTIFLAACSIIPFIVFQFREKGYLLFTVLLSYLLITSVDKLNPYLELNMDMTFFHSEAFNFISMLISIGILTIYTFILSTTARASEKYGEKTFDLLKKSEANTEAIKQQLNSAQNEMSNYKAEQEKLKELEKQREWINSGITKFVDILRLNNDDIKELTYNVISNLVKYLGANQGGIFMLVEENNDLEKNYFELTAAYAYEKRKFINKKILYGEGLVGSCAIEKKKIVLKEIPGDYIKITSGLGEATPKNILIIPIINEEKVYGVIEIASFNEFKDYEIDFTEKVAENIGSAVLNTIMHNKTNALVAEMKKQAEYNHTQEEELRQNIEEMQATQEEMHKKEKLLIELANELGLSEQELNLRINKMGYR